MASKILVEIKWCKSRLEIAERLSVNAPTEKGRNIYAELLKYETALLDKLQLELNLRENALLQSINKTM